MSSKSYSEEDEYSTESGEVEFSQEGYNEEENESEDEENEDESGGGGGENEDDEVENEGGEEENESEEEANEDDKEEVENEGGEEENEDDESGDGGEETENDVEQADGEEDPPSDVEDPKWIGALLQLWRLYVHVDLKNCDDLIPDWDYKSAAEEPMQIEWICDSCHQSMGVLAIHFLNEGPEQDRVHLGVSHCNQIYSVIMKDWVCKPCTQAYKTVPYFGVLMGFLVGNATPVRYLNPPLFKATMVVDNVAHTLRNIEPNRSTSITYEFMGLQQRKRPKVGKFKLSFYNEKMWAKAEVFWTREYKPPMVHEAASEQSESGSDQD